MIITKLMGGLGNQMFQYATGRRLAAVRNTDLLLDLTWYDDPQNRKFDLKHFKCSLNEATPRVLEQVSTSDNQQKGFLRRIWKRTKGNSWTLLEEPHFHFFPEMYRAPDFTYLSGYWQSEKYFKDISATIHSDFQLRKPLEGEYRELEKEILDCESVGIHIRRGDYVSNPAHLDAHGICSMDYYRRAMEIIDNSFSKAVYFFFSDGKRPIDC